MKTGKEILEELLVYLNITPYKFAENIGYKRPQFIYDIQSGKTKNISSKLAKNIIEYYTEFNLSWLLTGEGEMLKSNTYKIKEKESIASTPKSEYGSINYLSIIDEKDKEIKRLNENIDSLVRIVEMLSKTNSDLNKLVKEHFPDDKTETPKTKTA